MAKGTANPRPKRGAEQWTRTHHTETGPSKKARFDLRNPSALAPDAPDEEEDAYLEADEMTKRGAQTKRNAVNIDGFESDSSNEGFDARAAAKAREKKEAEKAAASKDEEDNDMFADLEEDLAPDGDADEELNREGKKNKDVKFADLDQVEGMEEGSKAGGHVHAPLPQSKGKSRAADEDGESTSEESEVDDEQRAGLDGDMDAELGAGAKKKHAPKLDAFNLSAEKEEGNFDESLNFVRKAVDPDAIYDTWMDGTSKKDMRRAKEAQAKRDNELRQQARVQDALDTGDVLATLIGHLQAGENSLGALARLAPKKEKKKSKPKWQIKKEKAKSGDMDVDDEEAPPSAEPDEAEVQRRKTVDEITGASDVLMQRAVIDINDSREILMKHYRRETGQEWAGAKSASGNEDIDDNAELWEFRWSSTDEQIQGPEPRDKMKAWSDAGYFAGDVQFRPAGSSKWRTNVAF